MKMQECMQAIETRVYYKLAEIMFTFDGCNHAYPK
jgi:hypothetical protein